MDFFRKLFGFSDRNPHTFDERHEPSMQPYPDDPRRFFDFGHQEDDHPFHGSNFNIFSDPMEMHRYFEQQMDQMLKSFGFPHFAPSDDSGVTITEIPSDDTNDIESRDYFLKKGHTFDSHGAEKVDKDLDGKLTIKDLDTLFKNPKQHLEPPNDGVIADRKPQSFAKSFFKSMKTQTIRNPDGSYETHRTVTDSEGNEETTITRRVGDKEHTIVKKRDKSGKEVVDETMVNMGKDDSLIVQPSLPNDSFDQSMFSRFFKF